MDMLGILTSICLRCTCGRITKDMNEKKGYDGGFAWGFWLGLIGIIVVALKKDNTTTDYRTRSGSSDYWNKVNGQSAEKPGNPKKGQWQCVCGQANDSGLDYCLRCRRTRAEQPQKKNCLFCGGANVISNTTCFACGRQMHHSATVSLQKESTEAAIPGVDESTSLSCVEQLEKISVLKDSGVLTEAEFDAAKARILSKL